MIQGLLHTPEGVRDIYSEECEKKLLLQDTLLHVLRQYGYRPIQTPTFEFFDTFGKEIGTTPAKDLYKFFDKEGNTLVLRPDITPSIARCSAMYFREETFPLRLCYMGNIFINNNSYQGRLKESTQLGAELLGDSTADADAEVIAMAIDCLKKAGLKEFQISIGHAEFFRGLTEAAGLQKEQEEELLHFISNKNYFGVIELAETFPLNENLKALFRLLGNFSIKFDELTEAKRYAADYPRILTAIERLEEVYQILFAYEIENYVSIELGIVSHYEYYTGIIFFGYTFGSGEPIVKGGRYDKLLTYFGKNCASIGFAIVIDQLMAALFRQNIEICIQQQAELIVYEKHARSKAIKVASKLRSYGIHVILIAKDADKSEEDYRSYAAKNHLEKVTFI